jgi:hypothetical protein
VDSARGRLLDQVAPQHTEWSAANGTPWAARWKEGAQVRFAIDAATVAKVPMRNAVAPPTYEDR